VELAGQRQADPGYRARCLDLVQPCLTGKALICLQAFILVQDLVMIALTRLSAHADLMAVHFWPFLTTGNLREGVKGRRAGNFLSEISCVPNARGPEQSGGGNGHSTCVWGQA
jgi:hypothetical protein